jgi:hypothetical protein
LHKLCIINAMALGVIFRHRKLRYSELPEGDAFFCALSRTPTECRRTPLFLCGCFFFKPR